jgi:TrmH family RNA methyltransferase
MLRAAHEAGAHIEQIFVGDDVDDDITNSAALTSASNVVRVDSRTLQSLAQTTTPQGVVAAVEFVDRAVGEISTLVPREGSALVLVLPNLADPGNAGTLIRSAEAFGVRAVCFGPHAVEPYNGKVVRASMGSLFRVPLVRYRDWIELTGAFAAARLAIVAADASGEDVRSVTLPQRVALVVGQERHGFAGIPRADLGAVVSVPQREGVESLNAGVAGSIVLYECARAHGFLSPAQRQVR